MWRGCSVLLLLLLLLLLLPCSQAWFAAGQRVCYVLNESVPSVPDE
jgi:hypothetical protein